MKKSVLTNELTNGLKTSPQPLREKVKFPLLFADIYMETETKYINGGGELTCQ